MQQRGNELDVLLMTTNFGLKMMQEPYGIGILSSLFKQHGFSTMMLEPGVDALSWQQCLEIVRQNRPRILGISLLFDGAVEAVTELVREAKKSLPSLNVFLGGQAVTTGLNLPVYAPLTHLCDSIFVGEAELNAPEYARRVIRQTPWQDLAGIAFRDGTGKLVVNPPAPRLENLDEVPLQDRSVLRQIMERHPGYKTAAVQAGRGCASSCSFCSYGTLRKVQNGQKKLRRKSFAGVFQEIEHLYKELGIRDFHIEDESFFEQDPEYNQGLIWLANSLRQLPEKISFDILARIDCVDLEATRALKEAGMTRIFVGVDSADEEDLRLYGKGYTAAQVHEGMEKLLSLGYSLDVDAEYRVQTGYITWNPYSTLQRIRNAFEFFKRYHNTPKLIQHFLFIFSGTPLKKKVKLDGLFLEEAELVGSTQLNFRFLHPEMDRLFRQMIAYFDVWSPFRDGIRMVEKKVRLEVPEAQVEIADLIDLRRRCDQHFYDSFEAMLRCTEEGGTPDALRSLREQAVAELQELVPVEVLHRIDAFCRKYDMGGNIVEMIRANPITLARYKL